MNNIIIFDIVADICGLLFCVIGVTVLAIWHKFLKNTFKYFVAILSANAVSLLANMFGLIFKGTSGDVVHTLLAITNFVEFASGYALSLLFTLFLFHYIEKDGVKIKYKKWPFLYFAIELLMLVISQFNHMFYYINSSNIYCRGELFYVSQAVAILSMVADLVVIVIYRKSLNKNEMVPFFVYIFFPVAALIIQMFMYGIYILLLSTTVSAFLMFVMMLSIQVKDFYEKEKELSDMRLRLTFSQMQPHFLFNTLVAIKHLCKIDSEAATQSIENFSYYLRGNIDSITCNKCIPFNTELEHIKNYLSLEKKRFGDRLSISLDLKEKDFFIPPLTLLTIVENAVKYGTTQKLEGVEIKVSSFCDDKNYYVEVVDNGLGFDTENYKNDGKKHIGIDGVKIRLENMCGGSLKINSIIGAGTHATIIIPLENR